MPKRRRSKLLTAMRATVAGLGCVVGYFGPDVPHLGLGLTSAERRQISIVSRARQERFESVVFGDSIVEQSRINDLCGDYVLNAGFGGARVAGVLRLAKDVLPATAPKRIVIAVGGNDAKRGHASPRGEFVRDYTALLSLASQTGASVAIATIAPVGKDSPDGNTIFDPALLHALNGEIRALGAKFGVPVIPFDQMPTSEGFLRAELTTDGVHLSTDGYREWIAMLEGACELAKATAPAP